MREVRGVDHRPRMLRRRPRCRRLDGGNVERRGKVIARRCGWLCATHTVSNLHYPFSSGGIDTTSPISYRLRRKVRGFGAMAPSRSLLQRIYLCETLNVPARWLTLVLRLSFGQRVELRQLPSRLHPVLRVYLC